MDDLLATAARIVNNWGARPPAHACTAAEPGDHCHCCAAWDNFFLAVRTTEAKAAENAASKGKA